jgi:TonB family protein
VITSSDVVDTGGVPGDQEVVPGGSGGTEEEGVVTASPPPPPPPPDTSVELLLLPRIAYPENARSDGVEGRVRLWVQLDETGQVLSVEVLDEPGSGLGDAARKALLNATFKPPTHLGRREATAFEYVYRFQLL